MTESSDKVPIARAGPDDVEFCSPPVSAARGSWSRCGARPHAGPGLRVHGPGLGVCATDCVGMGGGQIRAPRACAGWHPRLWCAGATGSTGLKISPELLGKESITNSCAHFQIYNVHYTMSINGKLQDGSMEIDAGNNLETFKMGSGAEEAIEVNDFQNGITGIRFAGGEKCYIKAQVKARVPEVGTVTKQSISSELEGKIMPVKYEENSLIWVAVDQPVKDSSFLSSKVLELCGDLPIFWLKPTYPKEIQRERREVVRKTVPTTTRRPSSGPRGNPGPGRPNNETRPSVQEDSEPFNPDNPYHQQEGESMTFDPRLDHEGICCIECRRSYTHCQKICEPLGGYYPWPYNYHGCRSACRVVMPCSWWVARILGMV
ncbi:leukocyte cell-derived chemotaxin 1 [Carlito syrichta]|uniref:Leukocyte cell-derived chemotaxin 1 n=1 Tax=Carlito syrichta TaxID=1868482 RepID=A0A1U7TX64_CARSF|nr:leukocyte cell-derived chemotaxin 1 [Carlito syrichta]